MTHRILFPFSFDKNFRRGYAWAMELALRMDATLYFFTAVSDHDHNEENLPERILRSLLNDYLRDGGRGAKTAIAKTERLVEKGELNGSLIRFVKKTKFDVIVVDREASGFSLNTIHDVVENSNGVIVLPSGEEQPPACSGGEAVKSSTEDFYDVLTKADCYQLQSNFFHRLGQDKRLFDYFRYFFHKKGPAFK